METMAKMLMAALASLCYDIAEELEASQDHMTEQQISLMMKQANVWSKRSDRLRYWIDYINDDEDRSKHDQLAS